MQETFIQVWKHLGTFRGEGSVRSWILRIAHREAIAALRRRGHRHDGGLTTVATSRDEP